MDSPCNKQTNTFFEKAHQNNQRVVRRIEGLEMKVSRAAPHDKVQRLTRRVEALELRLLAEPPSPGREEREDPGVEPSKKGEGPSKREEELEKEVVLLQTAVGSLEEKVKSLQGEMKEMLEVMKTALEANVSVFIGKVKCALIIIVDCWWFRSPQVSHRLNKHLNRIKQNSKPWTWSKSVKNSSGHMSNSESIIARE